MTRRLTISVSDEVAAELDDLPAGQVCGVIAEALRRHRVSDTARAALSAAGHRGFPFDPSGARRRLAAGRVDARTRDAAVTTLAALSGHDRDTIVDRLGRSAAAFGW